MAQIRQILKKKSSNRYFFNDTFQYVANNIEGCFLNFLIAYLVFSHVWLNYFLDDLHFGDISKSLKQTLALPLWMVVANDFSFYFIQFCDVAQVAIIHTTV